MAETFKPSRAGVKYGKVAKLRASRAEHSELPADVQLGDQLPSDTDAKQIPVCSSPVMSCPIDVYATGILKTPRKSKFNAPFEQEIPSTSPTYSPLGTNSSDRELRSSPTSFASPRSELSSPGSDRYATPHNGDLLRTAELADACLSRSIPSSQKSPELIDHPHPANNLTSDLEVLCWETPRKMQKRSRALDDGEDVAISSSPVEIQEMSPSPAILKAINSAPDDDDILVECSISDSPTNKKFKWTVLASVQDELEQNSKSSPKDRPESIPDSQWWEDVNELAVDKDGQATDDDLPNPEVTEIIRSRSETVDSFVKPSVPGVTGGDERHSTQYYLRDLLTDSMIESLPLPPGQKQAYSRISRGSLSQVSDDSVI